MKKLLSLLLVLALTLGLCACGAAGTEPKSDKSGEETAQTQGAAAPEVKTGFQAGYGQRQPDGSNWMQYRNGALQPF